MKENMVWISSFYKTDINSWVFFSVKEIQDKFLFLSFINLIEKKCTNTFEKIVSSIVCLVSLINFLLSFSRTGLILLIVFFACFLIKKKNVLLISLTILLFFLSIFVFFLALRVEIPLLSIYCRKFITSLEEIGVNHNWASDYERTRYWRGFEIYSALHDLSNKDCFALFFGNGFGYSVELLFSQPLGTIQYINLPILHNAYLAIMTKFGIVGLFLMLCSYALPFIIVIKQKLDLNKIIAISLWCYILASPFFVMSIFSSCTFGATVFFFACFQTLCETSYVKTKSTLCFRLSSNYRIKV